MIINHVGKNQVYSAGGNILAVKEPRGVLVEFNRYEIEHDSFGGFIPVRCWVTDDFKLRCV